MGDICPKCGKDTFETVINAPFDTDPHQEGKCHNPDCGARGRIDILTLQSEIVKLKSLIEKHGLVNKEKGRDNQVNQDGNGRRGKHKL